MPPARAAPGSTSLPSLRDRPLTVIRIEKIRCLTADTPEVRPLLEAEPPDDSRHRRVDDLIRDGPEHSLNVEIEGFEM